MLDFEHQLIGVFETEKYSIGDYEIIVSQITDGYKVTFIKGDESQEMTIKNGESPDLTDVKNLLETMRGSIAGNAEAEEARGAAEDQRESAEAKRKDLYNKMLTMYNNLNYYITQANTAKAEAIAAKEAAEAVAANVVESLSNVTDRLFYSSGDVITFGDSGTAQSTSLNASGYVVANKDKIHLKIPVAKRLDYITSVSCQSFVVHIVNTGGYAMASGFQAGGYNFINNIESIYIDRAQNCIHVNLSKLEGFTLKANECVSARVGNNRNGVPAVKFTLS